MTKVCTKCKTLRSDYELGRKSCDRCLLRARAYAVKYRASLNKDEVNAHARAKYAENPSKYREIRKRWSAANGKEQWEKARLRPNFAEQRKAWKANNPEKLAKYRKKRMQRPEIALRAKLRCRVSAAIKRAGGYKNGSVLDLVGGDIPTLRTHLESQFQPGMHWGNHNLRGWHIDHIIPCAAFDLNNIEAQQECFSWRNLQPLWAHENLTKNAKILTGGPVSALA